MTASARRRFLFWFAKRNLFAPETARSTRVNRQTIALVTCFSLTTLGLALGIWRVRVERQMSDRLNLCLFIGNPNDGARITPEVLRQIRSEVPKHLREPAKFLCAPFSEVKYDWFEAAEPGEPETERAEPRTLELRGRTIAPGDPLLGSRELTEGPGRADPGFSGVAITPTMRRLLKLPTPLPPTLRLRNPITQAPAKVPLAGVMKAGELPFEHDFVLPEAVEEAHVNTESDAPSQYIDTGPVPADWPKPGEPQPKEFDRAIRAYHLKPPRQSPNDKRAWRLTSTINPPSRAFWQACVGAIRDIMKKAGKTAPDDFVLGIRSPHSGKAVRRTSHEMAGLYVGDDPDLKPAALAVRGLQFKANEATIEALEAIGRTSRRAFAVLGAVALVFLFNGWSNMYVIQRLRAERMRAEIGMLKAIGMDQKSLRDLILVEGLILWVGGAARGVVLASLAGLTCAYAFIAEAPREIWTAFACPWWLVFPVLATTALAFLASSILASRAARLAAPISTLRGS